MLVPDTKQYDDRLDRLPDSGADFRPAREPYLLYQ